MIDNFDAEIHVSDIFLFTFSLDPNNRDAVNQLVALGDVSNENNKELDQTATSSQLSTSQSEQQDNNAEMVDVQPISPPGEMLPTIDDEDDSSVW